MSALCSSVVFETTARPSLHRMFVKWWLSVPSSKLRIHLMSNLVATPALSGQTRRIRHDYYIVFSKLVLY